jgi:hypothetical protein
MLGFSILRLSSRGPITRLGCKGVVRIYILNLQLMFGCVILISTRSFPCSRGKTPLNLAIDCKETHVVALLRSVGAAE